VWSPEVVRFPELRASWCNGLAGSTMLWVKAFDVTGNEAFLVAARAAARALEHAPARSADLCCGIGGTAYALLELSRVDRRGPWRDEARALAVDAITRAQLRWPNGLLRGHAGLVCLASDLIGDAPRGFPAING
jgi:hypothetical protein